jgi:hypothetical protein
MMVAVETVPLKLLHEPALPLCLQLLETKFSTCWGGGGGEGVSDLPAADVTLCVAAPADVWLHPRLQGGAARAH